MTLAFSGALHAGPDEKQLSVHGQLASRGEATDIAVRIGSGGYVAGLVYSDHDPVTVELLDADEKVMRELARNASGQIRFFFVAPTDHPKVRITAESTSGAAFTMTFDHLVERKDQIPPARRYQSPMIANAAKAVAEGAGTDAFWALVSQQGAPLVEPRTDSNVVLTFLARGLERNGRILGAPSNDHEFLERLGDSDIWFKSFVVPYSTRLSYKIARDIPEFDADARARRVAILATAQADPLNPNVWPDDAPDIYNQKSVIELDHAPEQPGMAGNASNKGTLWDFEFDSPVLGNKRTITLYRPYGFDPGNEKNVLLVLFDSREYRETVPTPAILDNLIEQGVLPPVSVAFIANPDGDARGRELPGNPVFADVLANDLMPVVFERFGTNFASNRIVIGGSSYGGLASMTIAMRHPELFGNVLSMSGSFWWSPDGTPADQNEYVSYHLAHTDKRPVRIFMMAGLFETGRGDVAGILESNRHLRDVLLAKEYDVTYREYAGGHDYLVWRGALADGLITLFGPAHGPS